MIYEDKKRDKKIRNYKRKDIKILKADMDLSIGYPCLSLSDIYINYMIIIEYIYINNPKKIYVDNIHLLSKKKPFITYEILSKLVEPKQEIILNHFFHLIDKKELSSKEIIKLRLQYI